MDRVPLNSTFVGDSYLDQANDYAGSVDFSIVPETGFTNAVIELPAGITIATQYRRHKTAFTAGREVRADAMLTQSKKNSRVDGNPLANLSPFIFLALTILAFVIALKTLPKDMAEALYAYLSVFGI